MLVILLSVGILEIMLIDFVQRYYYNNLDEILTNQIITSADFYSRYFSNATLEENVMDDIDVFWKQTAAQVQILDTSGTVLMDSIGYIPDEPIQTHDIKKAAAGEKGRWMGRVSYDSSAVMAVSYPLKTDGRIVGVLRFITSLREVNKGIYRISLIFLIVGGIVILITGSVSFFLANSIISPIKELTYVAQRIGAGNLNIRSRKRTDDEIGKLSDTMNYMTEEILKKDRLKNEFICSVSHELRTPLTAIRGWADTLNTEESLEDCQVLKEGLNIISREAERLTHMVEELLDFSRFVSGKVTLEKEEVSIKFLIEHIKRYMAPRAQREDIRFMVKYEDDMPSVQVDKNRIKQVLINILDNAFTFTNSKGCICVEAKAERNFIVISVSDNGCGIGPEELPKVKEKFYKGKSSKSQNGIGLSICDEIIKLHKGIFEIDSELGKGTTVYIKLPLTY